MPNAKRNLSENGLNLLVLLEGLVKNSCGEHVLYEDSAGLPTIGYGHLIQPGEQLTTLTEEQAQGLLRVDLERFEQAVNGLVATPIDQYQFDALVIFAFNIGVAGFARSTALRLTNAQDFAKVPAAMALWNKARINGKLQVLPGLVRRRAAEGELFLRGVGAALHDEDRTTEEVDSMAT